MSRSAARSDWRSPDETASALERPEGDLDHDRQQRHQQRADEQARILLPRQPVDDVAAQPAARDERAERCRGDDGDRRVAHAGHDERRADRQLDVAQHLALAQAHAARRLDDVADRRRARRRSCWSGSAGCPSGTSARNVGQKPRPSLNDSASGSISASSASDGRARPRLATLMARKPPRPVCPATRRSAARSGRRPARSARRSGGVRRCGSGCRQNRSSARAPQARPPPLREVQRQLVARVQGVTCRCTSTSSAVEHHRQRDRQHGADDQRRREELLDALHDQSARDRPGRSARSPSPGRSWSRRATRTPAMMTASRQRQLDAPQHLPAASSPCQRRLRARRRAPSGSRSTMLRTRISSV